MSASDENFKAASKTLQLKHQIAYWKARALALEYENGVLHDVIRQIYLGGCTTLFEDSEESVNNKKYDQSENIAGTPNENDSDNNENESESDDNYNNDIAGTPNENDSDNNENESESDDNYNNDGLEVSQEFIQFLFANAKYKEDEKCECEQLKAEIEKEDETDNIELQR